MLKWIKYRKEQGNLNARILLIDLGLNPYWIKYKVWRFFAKRKSWKENKYLLERIDYTHEELYLIFGTDLEPSAKKIEKYLKKACTNK